MDPSQSRGIQLTGALQQSQCFQLGVVTCSTSDPLPPDVPPNETPIAEPLLRRFGCSISLLISFILSWTHNDALQAATSDVDADRAIQNLKSEWITVGRWLLGLAAMNMSLFTIDTQSLFKVDDFALKAIATSAVASGLGILCDACFLLQFHHLQCQNFMNRTRDANGSHRVFALSAALPALAALVALGALMAFGGRVLCSTVPALAVALPAGLALAALVVGLRCVVRGAARLLGVLARWRWRAPSASARWIGSCVVNMLLLSGRAREGAAMDSLPV